MIFEVQRYLEEYIARRGLRDPDGFAVSLANAFDAHRRAESKPIFLTRMLRMRTVFFKANAIREKQRFEARLLDLLDAKFPQKKKRPPALQRFPEAL